MSGGLFYLLLGMWGLAGFLFGLSLGLRLQARRKPSLNAQLGELVAGMINDVIKRAKFCGPPVHVSKWVDTDESDVGTIRLTIERLPQ